MTEMFARSYRQS